MKKASSVLLIAGSLFILNIQRAPIADTAIITTAKVVENVTGNEFKVDVQKSTLGWIGTKATGTHSGTINMTNGTLSVNQNAIVGGGFTLDMNTIVDTDMEGSGKSGLEGHLKGADFFDVAKYPTANFEITSVMPMATEQKSMQVGATNMVTGNLNMRGNVKSISFPAVIVVSDKKVTASAIFNIDRTQWGIVYGADGKVAKEINLKLNLEANTGAVEEVKKDDMPKDEEKKMEGKKNSNKKGKKKGKRS
jgi:polyisoprenoid-binding protein YceI